MVQQKKSLACARDDNNGSLCCMRAALCRHCTGPDNSPDIWNRPMMLETGYTEGVWSACWRSFRASNAGSYEGETRTRASRVRAHIFFLCCPLSWIHARRRRYIGCTSYLTPGARVRRAKTTITFYLSAHGTRSTCKDVFPPSPLRQGMSRTGLFE